MHAVEADVRPERVVREEHVDDAEARLRQPVHSVEAEVRVAVLARLRLHIRVHLRHAGVDRVHVARGQHVIRRARHVGAGGRRRRLGQQRQDVARDEEIVRAEVAVETHRDPEGEQIGPLVEELSRAPNAREVRRAVRQAHQHRSRLGRLHRLDDLIVVGLPVRVGSHR